MVTCRGTPRCPPRTRRHRSAHPSDFWTVSWAAWFWLNYLASFLVLSPLFVCHSRVKHCSLPTDPSKFPGYSSRNIHDGPAVPPPLSVLRFWCSRLRTSIVCANIRWPALHSYTLNVWVPTHTAVLRAFLPLSRYLFWLYLRFLHRASGWVLLNSVSCRLYFGSCPFFLFFSFLPPLLAGVYGNSTCPRRPGPTSRCGDIYIYIYHIYYIPGILYTWYIYIYYIYMYIYTHFVVSRSLMFDLFLWFVRMSSVVIRRPSCGLHVRLSRVS